MITPTSEDIRTQFEKDGYYLAKSLFDPEQLQKLEASFDQILAQLEADSALNNARWQGEQMDELDGGSSVILHTHNIQSYSAEWAMAFYNKKFLDAAEAILGPDIMLHHSKLFYKPPHQGAPFPMHQDWEHFPTEHDSMIAAVIHLNSADEHNGCLRVYPGSYKAGRLAGMKGEGEDSYARDEYSVADATAIPAQPGDVLFFHYMTVHGSGQNLSDTSRKTVIAQLHSGSDRVIKGNNHTNVKLVLRGFNHHASRHRVGSIR